MKKKVNNKTHQASCTKRVLSMMTLHTGLKEGEYIYIFLRTYIYIYDYIFTPIEKKTRQYHNRI